MNFMQFLETSFVRHPDKTAIIVGERRLTYAAMCERVYRLSDTLSNMGIVRGDRIAIAACNCLEYPEIVFACAHLGVIAVMMNWRMPVETLQKLFVLNEVRAAILCLKDPEKEAALEAACSPMPVFRINAASGGRSYEELLQGNPRPQQSVSVQQDEILMHIHTSGTTGLPKPVMYSHGGFMGEVLVYINQLEISVDTVYQQMTQMFHSACIGMFSCLAKGATVIALDHFDPGMYLDTIRKERPTRLALIPSILQQILNYPQLDEYDLCSVREIAYSAAPMPPRLIESAMRVIDCKYYTTYGMTEMGPIVTALGPAEHQRKHLLKSVGRPIPGCEVQIVSEDGRLCAPGETGEICARGYSLMKGYFHMPEETAKAIREGWLHTGDLGYLDEEGYLYLQGRKGNMIITGGENVYPIEVQNALTACSEDVTEAVAYGVQDEKWGEAVIASVILRPGSKLTEKALRELCRKYLADYQVPKRILIEESLPRNQVGKVLIRTLIERFSSSGMSVCDISQAEKNR